MEITQIVNRIKKGEFVIVKDDQDRENEADLIIAAEKINSELMAFLIRYTSGIVCVPMQEKRLQELGLGRITDKNTVHFKTPFAVPVDYLPTSRGGVSAQERVDTIHALINPKTDPLELGRPGHIFPLYADPLGLKNRQGHTEAALELVMQAGLYPAAVIAELTNDDGTMMREMQLDEFAEQHGILICSIEEIINS